MRSVLPLVELSTEAPDASTPEYTRMNVSWPTNGSVMILNASAANGFVSSAGRSIGVSSALSIDTPWIAGMSIGDGRKSTTASSSGCTPLFLKAEPQMTGTNGASLRPCTDLFTRRRRAALISASVISSPLRYFSSSASSASLTFSSNCSR